MAIRWKERDEGRKELPYIVVSLDLHCLSSEGTLLLVVISYQWMDKVITTQRTRTEDVV